ncbi:MAG: MBL fold metallo-hydrolase [Firmicutes bacterium]|nr:MBL fold metallo-hydrolase [Bacillota bacterium]
MLEFEVGVDMKIEILKLGYLETNCYLLKKDKNVIIIDPAADASTIINLCKNYHVEGILVTHHHDDHIGALLELEKNYELNHNSFLSNNFHFDVIPTPGHTHDSLSFYFPKEKILFSGDFIFKNSIGRFDFPESSAIQMKESLNKISTYPDDIIIYPGHGPSTILGQEKTLFNYYF